MPSRLTRRGNSIDVCPLTEPLPGDPVVIADNGCWLWEGRLDHKGYPFRGAKRAHRYYFVLAYGQDALDARWVVHHRCETPRCVNPAHLEAKTITWHMREHKLQEKTVLTWDQARELRQRAQTDATVGYPQLAREYGCSIGHVQDIVEGIAFYEPGVQWIKPDRDCLYCGTPIGQERRRNAKYCDVDCRLAAYREAA